MHCGASTISHGRVLAGPDATQRAAGRSLAAQRRPMFVQLLCWSSALLTRGDVLRLGVRVGSGAMAVGVARKAIAIPPITPEQMQQVQEGKSLAPPPPPEPLVYYTPPSVKGSSSPEALALAKHLKSKDAKMYGAYWCSHCYNQKMLFGAGATRQLNYVECAGDGYKSQQSTCKAKDVPGYPTWEIDGKFYGGERSLLDLATISGFAAQFNATRDGRAGAPTQPRPEAAGPRGGAQGRPQLSSRGRWWMEVLHRVHTQGAGETGSAQGRAREHGHSSGSYGRTWPGSPDVRRELRERNCDIRVTGLGTLINIFTTLFKPASFSKRSRWDRY